MELSICGTRPHFYQWDVNQRIMLKDAPAGSYMNFGRPDGGTYVVEAVEENGAVFAAVPNAWLQLSGQLHVYVRTADQTEYHTTLFVAPRNKPDSYVYEETEILAYETLDARLKRLEGEGLAQAVADYLEKNPVTGSRLSIGVVELLAEKWEGSASPYSQVVTIPGVTPYSQVDLTPSVEQLAIFHDKDLAFVTENDDGVVTVYAIGDKPLNDYTMQVTIKEVSV